MLISHSLLTNKKNFYPVDLYVGSFCCPKRPPSDRERCWWNCATTKFSQLSYFCIKCISEQISAVVVTRKIYFYFCIRLITRLITSIGSMCSSIPRRSKFVVWHGLGTATPDVFNQLILILIIQTKYIRPFHLLLIATLGLHRWRDSRTLLS